MTKPITTNNGVRPKVTFEWALRRCGRARVLRIVNNKDTTWKQIMGNTFSSVLYNRQ